MFSVHTWSRCILTHLACLDSEDAPEDNLRAGCHHPASDALGVGHAPQAEGEHAGPPRAGPAHCVTRGPGPRLQGTRGHRAVAPTVEDDISGRINLSGAPGSAGHRVLSDNEEIGLEITSFYHNLKSPCAFIVGLILVGKREDTFGPGESLT